MRWNGKLTFEVAFRLRLDGTTGPDWENETRLRTKLLFSSNRGGMYAERESIFYFLFTDTDKL